MRPAAAFAISFLMKLCPPTRGFAFKRFLLRVTGAKLGSDVRVCSSARFAMTGELQIGKGSWLGHDFLLVGGDAAVSIGRDCDIGPRVTMVTGSHELLEGAERAAGEGLSETIIIGDGCWIGTGATVLGGTIIGKSSMIAAGSVVKGEFPDRVLIGGVPARVIRPLNGNGL